MDIKTYMPWAVVFGMLILAALTGVASTTVLTAGIIVCFGVLLLCDKLYLAFPFVIFYNASYGTALGVSVLRVFTILVLFNLLFRLQEKYRVKATMFIPLTVYVLFVALVMVPHTGVESAVYILMDVVCCFIVVSSISKDLDKLRSFFKVYTLICLISFVSGILTDNYIHNEYLYPRFNGTFEDPNYMGFFFTIGIWSLICLKLFDKRIRYCFVVIMYMMMLMTISITAIVVNVVVWIIYFIVMKKLKWKSLIIALAIILLLISLYNYGLYNPDAAVIGAFAERIENSFANFLLGNLGDATTGRTDLAAEHMEYFWTLPLPNILFGGIPSNYRVIHLDLRAAAHNEYVDMLLNVGIVGTVLMLGYFISTLVDYWKKYKESQKDEYLFCVIGKSVWIFYSMTLTLFLDYRFMFMFLI